MWWYCGMCGKFFQGSSTFRPACGQHGLVALSGPYPEPKLPPPKGAVSSASPSSQPRAQPQSPTPMEGVTVTPLSVSPTPPSSVLAKPSANSSSPKLPTLPSGGDKSLSLSTLSAQPSSSAKKPLDTHWYVDDEMALLLNSINDGSFDVLQPVMGTDLEAIGGSELHGVLSAYMQRFVRRRRAFIPVNLGNRHWVGLCLTFDPSRPQQPPVIQYFDSLAHAPDDDVMVALLKLFPALADMPAPRGALQTDGYNCGPWVVEWFRSLVAGTPLSAQLDMAVVRAQHDSVFGMAGLRLRLAQEERARLERELKRLAEQEVQLQLMSLGLPTRFSAVKSEGSKQVSQSSGSFTFFDSRKKCDLCKLPLELAQYATGQHWFSDCEFSHFICGACAMKQKDKIVACKHCKRLYWHTPSSDGCADCTLSARYRAHAKDAVAKGPVCTVPKHHAGKLGESLLAQHIKAKAGLEAIPVSNQHGIDLVVVTTSDAAYDALMTCLGAASSGSAHARGDKRESRNKTAKKKDRGAVIHCFEVKVNSSQFSTAQKNPDKFVEDRLKMALNRKYGDDAWAGAKRVEGFMDQGADWKSHLINVLMPRYQSPEYKQRNPIQLVHYNWGERESLGGTPQTLAANCDAYTYMDSVWIGDTGEDLAIAFLRGLGFDVCGSVQNASGNGVDLVARIKGTPTSPCWAFFEVKTSTVEFMKKLTAAEGNQWMFVMDRVNKALLGVDNFTNLGGAALATRMVANELWWQFQSAEAWRDRALYFQLMILLPGLGQTGAVQFKLISWPSKESKKGISSPFLVTYSTPQPLVSSVPSKGPVPSHITQLSMVPHPRGGRHYVGPCKTSKCTCFVFHPTSGDETRCANCKHVHEA